MRARIWMHGSLMLVVTAAVLSMGGCPIGQQAATPQFNPQAGTFSSAVSIEITSATDNATIYFTTDGSDPSRTNGTIFTDKIQVTQTTTIKAIAYGFGLRPSDVASAVYTIGQNMPPVISNASVIGSLTVGQESTITVAATVTDSDGTVQSVTADLSAIGGSQAQALTHGTGNQWSFTGQLTPNTEGSQTVTITAKDNGNASTTATLTVAVNTGPAIAAASASGFLFQGEARPIHLAVTATDANGSIASVVADLTAVGGPADQALSEGQNNLWTASVDVTAQDIGTQTITFTATDDKGGTATASVTIAVEAARPEAGTVKWTFPAGSGIHSSPALGADGTIYVASYEGGILFAINPDGTQKWNFITSGAVWASPSLADDGTIYIGSHDGHLYAIDPQGNQIWTFTTAGQFDASPAIGADGTLYVGNSDGNLYAINPDGTEKWHFTGGARFYGDAAIGADGTIYAGNWDNNLYAISPDGTQKWTFTTGDILEGAPAVGADGTIYVGSDDDFFYAINPDGTQKWSFATGGDVIAQPSIADDGTIYFDSLDQNLYAFNPDGTEKWTFTAGGQAWTTPAIGSDGMIYFGAVNDTLYILNPDGTQGGTVTTGGAIDSSPLIAPDGTLYVGSRDGNLYAVIVTGELAQTAWPMFQRGATHSGNVNIP